MEDYSSVLTVLILSCRRIDKLRQTLAAIQRHFSEIERSITPTFICFDNGSSSSDQVDLMRMGFNVLMLSPRNLGIGPAMNYLVGAVRTSYFLNLQDDWVLDNPQGRRFAEECIKILENDERIGQIKLDSAHAADFGDRRAFDGPFRAENAKVKYYVQNPRILWGGFTFPPGVARTSALRNVGPFLEENPYQRGYAESAYSAAFARHYVTVKSPDMRLFRHIGEQASPGWRGPHCA